MGDGPNAHEEVVGARAMGVGAPVANFRPNAPLPPGSCFQPAFQVLSCLKKDPLLSEASWPSDMDSDVPKYPRGDVCVCVWGAQMS